MQKTVVKSIFASACLITLSIFYAFDLRKAISEPSLFLSNTFYPSQGRQNEPNETAILSISTFTLSSTVTLPTLMGSSLSSKASISSPISQRNQDGKRILDLDISDSLKKCIGNEVLESVPQVFNSTFKNPCWINDQNNLRCLPYFYLAGTPKSGTSDLLSKINSHPDVMPTTKELQWWTRVRFSDGSASTLWDNYHFAEKFGSLEHLGCDVLRVVQPDVKIIGIFRNPADRLYSGYKFFKRRNKKSPEEFHSGVLSSIKTFNECLKNNDNKTCTYTYRGELRLNVGVYNIFVRDWIKCFPRHQMYFLRTDEWRNCTSELPKIYHFLELNPLSDDQILSICSEQQRNTNAAKKVGPMLSKTRLLLNEFYRPFMEDLAEVLGDTRYSWNL
ncbi:carbohydrate sulfotransferase 15-like isoform X2 [Antedon mediterranea]|uniref:carbohydrate sulfotransferase 15-like isoform X2 n=1 Tax=Antedon mediterranea TaxID=105859 RepID=UPI003AF5F3A4